MKKDVLSDDGRVLQVGDICHDSFGHLLFIEEGYNNHHKKRGLVAVNELLGIRDWLTVYPDGELTIFLRCE